MDGYIVSTAQDLIKWNYALYSGHIIPLCALDLMITPSIKKQSVAFYDDTDQLFSGYGIDIADNGRTKIYQHCGGTAGYQSKTSYDPTTQISIVNLSNFSEEKPSIFVFTNKLRQALRSINDRTN
jgi:CubicO group peptidase (beta-lactamase class C family)